MSLRRLKNPRYYWIYYKDDPLPEVLCNLHVRNGCFCMPYHYIVHLRDDYRFADVYPFDQHVHMIYKVINISSKPFSMFGSSIHSSIVAYRDNLVSIGRLREENKRIVKQCKYPATKHV